MDMMIGDVIDLILVCLCIAITRPFTDRSQSSSREQCRRLVFRSLIESFQNAMIERYRTRHLGFHITCDPIRRPNETHLGYVPKMRQGQKAPLELYENANANIAQENEGNRTGGWSKTA